MNDRETAYSTFSLDRVRTPGSFRGRNPVVVLLWQIFQAIIFGTSLQPMYLWRRMILRAFGAEIGRGVKIRPTARITYPWKVRIGDYSMVGDNATLYSLGDIEIGAHTVISQNSYLCAASHDYRKSDFPIFEAPIKVGQGVWIAADVFVGPGVTLGNSSIIGARSSVFKDIPDNVIAMGSPATVQRERKVG